MSALALKRAINGQKGAEYGIEEAMETAKEAQEEAAWAAHDAQDAGWIRKRFRLPKTLVQPDGEVTLNLYPAAQIERLMKRRRGEEKDVGLPSGWGA